MEELDLQKKQKMEAIKLLADWSKWLVTIETGGVAGVTFMGFKRASSINPICAGFTDALLVVAAIAFLISIFNACMLLFSLPSIVEQLPKAKQVSIDDMKDPLFKHTLIVYQRRQYLPFVTGLISIGLALLLYIISLDLPPIMDFFQHSVPGR